MIGGRMIARVLRMGPIEPESLPPTPPPFRCGFHLYVFVAGIS